MISRLFGGLGGARLDDRVGRGVLRSYYVNIVYYIDWTKQLVMIC